MPTLRGPLASLGATGKLGGHRRGATTRLRFFVQDFPITQIGSVPDNASLNTVDRCYFVYFLLPFHMRVISSIVYVASAATPVPLTMGIYTGNGGKLLGSQIGVANVVGAASYQLNWTVPVDLVPGAYYFALTSASGTPNMTIERVSENLTNPYLAAAAAGTRRYTGNLVLASPHNLPASFDPMSMAPTAGSHIMARLLGA